MVVWSGEIAGDYGGWLGGGFVVEARDGGVCGLVDGLAGGAAALGLALDLEDESPE